MNRCQWRRNIPGFIGLSLAVILLSLLMPLGTASLYAQPKLSEVVKDTDEVAEDPAEKVAKESEVEKAVKLEAKVPIDEFERGTPRRSIRQFLHKTDEGDFETAAEFLDLRKLSARAKRRTPAELARELRMVLARTILVHPSELSDNPHGYLEDGLPTYRERVGRIKSEKGQFDILLQRVPRGDGVYIWKFSNRTVRQIPDLYDMFSHGILEDILHPHFFKVRFLEIYLGEWVGMLALCIIAYLLAVVLTSPIYYLMHRKETALRMQLLKYFRRPFRLLVFILIGNELIQYLELSLVAQALQEAKTITFIILTWMAMRILDFTFSRMILPLKRRGKTGVIVLLPPLATALKVLLIIGVFIYWLDNIGVEVGTVLAGLGIGGLAVALAAQKSLENVIGAIMLYTSRPVKIGDFCRIGDKCGTVEEIGLRSTKIRTLDHTILSVPNAEMSSIQIENYAVRERLWYHPQIRLRYETTPDQIRYILVEVRKMFYSHPKVLDDPARIRFGGFGEYSLNLEIFAYIDVTDIDRFLEVAEDLNLRIMDIVAEAGTGFAIPAQALYLQRGKGLSEEDVQRAEQSVQQWKENQSLHLPSFPRDKIQELKGTLDYPPTGSSEAVTAVNQDHFEQPPWKK
jgi:MscS family membrane protein